VKEYILIARIVSVYGKEGYLKVHSYSDFPERFSGLKNVYIDFFGSKKLFTIENAKEKNNSLLMKFSNFTSAADAEILVGKEIFVEEKDAVKLPEDTYFIHDLIGSSVMEDGKMLGEIKDVLSYPANDVYVIETSEGTELLIPALRHLIESFDPVKKMMILKSGSSTYDED
jgi:16S rRNA processing protein RimM